MENCNPDMIFKIRFTNCSFPDFTQNLICLGSWPGQSNEKYTLLKDKDTGQYKCGIITVSKERTKLALATSSSCTELHGNRNNALEEYTFLEGKGLKVY